MKRNVRVCGQPDYHTRVGGMTTRQPGGFTLVELLVVISIVAVLASITLPVYFNMERSQQLNSCINNLRALGVAVAMYREDYPGYPLAPDAAYLQSGGTDPTYMPFSQGTSTPATSITRSTTPTRWCCRSTISPPPAATAAGR